MQHIPSSSSLLVRLLQLLLPYTCYLLLGGPVPVGEPLTQKHNYKKKKNNFNLQASGNRWLTSFSHLNSPCGDYSSHFTSVSCSFKHGFPGDFQIATSPRATYPEYNGRHCASLIMSIIVMPAEAEEELVRNLIKWDNIATKGFSFLLPQCSAEHIPFFWGETCLCLVPAVYQLYPTEVCGVMDLHSCYN